MTQPEYDAWLANAIKGYAQDKVQAGAREAGEASERSWAEFQWLLLEGLASADGVRASSGWAQLDAAPARDPQTGLTVIAATLSDRLSSHGTTVN